jgi:hypothetical protein
VVERNRRDAPILAHSAFPDIWNALVSVFGAWGIDRRVRGADWTRVFAAVNHEQAVMPFRLEDRLSEIERAMLMGGACAKAYGWSPKKGYSDEASQIRRLS